MGRRAIAYFWAAVCCEVEFSFVSVWNARGVYIEPDLMWLHELPLTWWYHWLEWIPFLLIFCLSFGRWNVDIYGEGEQRERTRGGGFRRGCIACMVFLAALGCLSAAIIVVRGGWWGVLIPVANGLALWNLYRALYPKNVPEGPEESA